jgi:hypothetical protein
MDLYEFEEAYKKPSGFPIARKAWIGQTYQKMLPGLMTNPRFVELESFQRSRFLDEVQSNIQRMADLLFPPEEEDEGDD